MTYPTHLIGRGNVLTDAIRHAHAALSGWATHRDAERTGLRERSKFSMVEGRGSRAISRSAAVLFS